MFTKPDPNVSFPALEERVLGLWRETRAFERSVEQADPKNAYVFYDGPPFATGLPHYGHLLASTLKDVVPRYFTMRGRRVERRFGWDTHGLPIEMAMEKELGLSGGPDIERYGIGKFNEACRANVLKYTAEWERIVGRLGRWVDFEHDYKTMNPEFMESVWWVFRRLWDLGLIYEGHKVMPYCPRCTTPLSNFEAGSNYKDVQDPSITVRFRLADGRDLLVWTTTPWTLPSNLAVAVGPDIDYVEVQDGAERCVLAEARVPAYYKEAPPVLARFKGRALVGARYAPLFPYFAGHPTAFVVIDGDFVSTEDGTGLVHMAPAYGEVDHAACLARGIALVDPVDRTGRFTNEVPDFAGQAVKEADKGIIKKLKAEGKLFRQDTIVHSYPFRWRTEDPLLYKAVSTWFVKVEALKDRMVANNARIHWVPAFVGEKRFGNWLRDARDWAISRNRYWGTPIPVWRCDRDPAHLECIGSRDDLRARSGLPLTDLHMHFVDAHTFACKCGGTMHRVSEVLDCWFESGAMPYAQSHYPFEDKQRFEARFPADFIAEGLDQTRGWFYTLLVLSTALFDKPAFQNVIVNGLILAEDGAKMSKSKKNYPDPELVLDEHGADALRAYMISSPVVRAEPLRFSEKGVREVVRQVLLPLWNAYAFFVTYANADGWTPSRPRVTVAERPELDRWIVSVMQSLIADVNAEMEAYRLYNVVPRLLGFIDDLTNWYIRRSRRRFWKAEAQDPDKLAGYATLYEVLTTFCRLLAPVLPFVTEDLYQNLVRAQDPGAKPSVHLERYPEVVPALIDRPLEQRIAAARQVVNLGLSLRNTHKLKVRQPLRRLTVFVRDDGVRAALAPLRALVAEELNVKEVVLDADETHLVHLSLKANFKSLGPRVGKKMKVVAAGIAALGPAELAALEAGGTRVIEGETVGLDDVLVERAPKAGEIVAHEGAFTVVVDAHVDAALRREGLAREVVNRLNGVRKDAGLEVSDRVKVWFDTADPELRAALEEHGPYIRGECLAEVLNLGPDGGDAVDIDGIPARIRLERV